MPAPRPIPPTNKPRRRTPPPMSGMWVWLMLLMGALLLVAFSMFPTAKSIEPGEFLRLVLDDRVNKCLKSVTFLGSEQIYGEVDRAKLEDIDGGKEIAKKLPANGKFSTVRLNIDEKQLSEKLNVLVQRTDGVAPLQLRRDENFFTQVGPIFMFLLPTLLIIGLLFFVLPRFRDPMGGGFLSNYIKSPAKRYDRTKQPVTFGDVAGMQNVKTELQEIVEYLKSPDKFKRLGAQIPKGVLLIGPPGTGKTLLARAVAGEAGVPFFSISGSEFIQMFVGVGASRVRDLFKTAKESSPCILFIDEIDAVGRMRGAGVGGGSDEREQTLNQILSEMDGFQPNEAVIVVAATNRPDVLDSALLRPGRFDRHITVDRPNSQDRLAILKVHTRTKPLADDVDLDLIARSMIGMTGADLRNLTNEAALLATRENKTKIERIDFSRAAERIIIGSKREEVLTEDDKRRTAYHEAGHVLTAWFQLDTDPPQKVSIIPRGRTLGITWTPPLKERYDFGEKHCMCKLVVLLGGRAADQIIYNEAYAGHENDLKEATRFARYMITHWGMSKRLGPMAFRVGEEHVFLGKELQDARDFSDGTAQIIDEEVQRLLREADEAALVLVKEHRDDLEKLVSTLLQKEEMLFDEIEAILGKPMNQLTLASLTSK